MEWMGGTVRGKKGGLSVEGKRPKKVHRRVIFYIKCLQIFIGSEWGKRSISLGSRGATCVALDMNRESRIILRKELNGCSTAAVSLLAVSASLEGKPQKKTKECEPLRLGNGRKKIHMP